MKTPLFLLVFLVTTSLWAQNHILTLDNGFAINNNTFSSKKTHHLSQQSYDSDNYDDENPFIELFVEIGLSITYGILIETYWEKDLPMHDARFTTYPYFDNKSGNYTYDEAIENPVKLVLSENIFAENKYLYGQQFNVQFKFLSRMDLFAGYTSFNNDKNTMPIYDVMLHYHRIRTPKLDIWYGLGAMHIAGTIEETGLSADFGGEWFVKKPISMMAQWQYGFFDYGYHVRRNTFAVKYHMQQYNIQFGVINYKMGNEYINTLSLGLNMYL